MIFNIVGVLKGAGNETSDMRNNVIFIITPRFS